MPGLHKAPASVVQEPGAPTKFRPFDWMRDVIATTGLSGHGTAAAFALVIMQRNGRIKATLMETIAAKAHLSKRTAERGIAELRAAGLIAIERRNNTKGRAASGYRLVETGAHAATAKAGIRQIGGNGIRQIGGTGYPPNRRDYLVEEEKGGGVTPFGRLMRQAEAGRLSPAPRKSRMTGAAPEADCLARNGARG